MQQTVEKILKKEAEDRNIPYAVIKEIYMSQFRIARKYASAGVKNKPETFYNIRIPFLGRFYTKEDRILKYLEYELQADKDKKGNTSDSSK